MKLGFINFSTEEQLKMHQVMQAIQEHQAIDELGLGRIRDAFSNKLFPGISTLHNRAKYYAILPSLFLEAEKGTYKSANEVRAKVLNLEIKLTRQLLRGTEPANNWGITGSSVIDAAEAENSKYVKYDPVYIYYGALVSYGMILTKSNIYSLIYEKSKTAPRTGPGPAVPPPRRLRDPDRVRSSANTRARRNRDCIRDCRNAARAGAGWMEVRSLPRGDARWLGNRLRREDLAGQRLGQLRAAVLVGQLRRVRHGSEGRNADARRGQRIRRVL